VLRRFLASDASPTQSLEIAVTLSMKQFEALDRSVVVQLFLQSFGPIRRVILQGLLILVTPHF
jgi:hypothetical protein